MVRIREHKVVLCLQGTTELDYNSQAMRGLHQLKRRKHSTQVLMLILHKP
jgi:hypothetical protein